MEGELSTHLFEQGAPEGCRSVECDMKQVRLWIGGASPGGRGFREIGSSTESRFLSGKMVHLRNAGSSLGNGITYRN